MARHDPPPGTLEVRLDPDAFVREGGRLLCGGAPFRLIRLSAEGARVVGRWRRGGRVGERPAQRALARRLLDGGLLLSTSSTRTPPPDELVVPVHDRLGELRACLRALTTCYPAARVVLVDDGSTARAEVAAIARQHGARLVRHDRSRGPAAARNAGLRATSGSLVGFVDSDVVVERGCLERLAAHFADPAVGAAAPRVLALDAGGSRLARYDAGHSTLDMGSRPASVGTGRRVPYVPSTTLVVRREAIPTGGFDAALEVGEDVDLIWRMQRGGWRVVYDPAATVRHDHRTRLAAFWRRRLQYAHSIGPLARRHPDALPALSSDLWSAGIVGLWIARRPRIAIAVAAVRLIGVRRRLEAHADRPGALAIELVGRSLVGAAHGMSHAVRRVWSPPLLVAALRSRRARMVLATTWTSHALGRGGGRLGDVPLLVADDLVAGLGTWSGALRTATLGPLLPRRP